MIYPAIIMGGLGLIFGALLAFATKKFYVETDPRQADIRAILPGANCGGCGYPGCDGFAEALVNGTAKITGCAAGGSALAERIAAILGVDAVTEEHIIAFLKCGWASDKTVKNCVYSGDMTAGQHPSYPAKDLHRAPMGVWDLGHVSAYARLTR